MRKRNAGSARSSVRTGNGNAKREASPALLYEMKSTRNEFGSDI